MTRALISDPLLPMKAAAGRLDEIRACVAGPVAPLRTQASTLADRIERHEARESDLLGDAMSTDVGAGDG